MNDRLDRAETAIQKLAEENVTIAASVRTLTEVLRALTERMQDLADSQKHSDAKLDALTDIVRNWYERHGNGNSGPRPS